MEKTKKIKFVGIATLVFVIFATVSVGIFFIFKKQIEDTELYWTITGTISLFCSLGGADILTHPEKITKVLDNTDA